MLTIVLLIIGITTLLLLACVLLVRKHRQHKRTPSPTESQPPVRNSQFEPSSPTSPPITTNPPALINPRVSVANIPEQTAAEYLRASFREIVQQYKLPPLPATVTRAMSLIRDPDIRIDHLCRVLSTDPALAGRIISLSRSPLYSLRRPPQTLHQATSALGLVTIRRILMTAGIHMSHMAHTPESQALWHHCLATALAAHMLARRTCQWHPDHAFLAGLLHDVGQMVFLQSDRKLFLEMWQEAGQDATCGCMAEKEAYGRDHAFISASILFHWKIDDEIVNAVLTHHSEDTITLPPHALSTILTVADYLTYQAGVGFVAQPPRPADDLLTLYQCATDEEFNNTIEEIRSAFATETNILK